MQPIWEDWGSIPTNDRERYCSGFPASLCQCERIYIMFWSSVSQAYSYLTISKMLSKENLINKFFEYNIETD